MNTIEYYRPSTCDADKLFQLEQLCFPAPWDLEEIEGLIARDPSLFTLAAYDSGCAIGYISAVFSAPGILHIISLGVHPDYRRRSIARNLLGSAVHWGRQMGAEKVTLEVRSQNAPAVSFYSKLNFSVKKELADFYGKDQHGLFMSKKLKPVSATLKTAHYLYNNLKTVPKIGVILGSGLGWATEPFGEGETINFSDIPGMAGQAVQGHGQMLRTSADGKIVFVMGRRHHYQGYSGDEITLLPAALASIGVDTWVLTSSAGAIDFSYKVGDVMIFTDHINFSGCIPESPDIYIGADVYSKSLQKTAEQCLKKPHKGVFACVSGPAYETAAEVDLIRKSGASAVSMSTAQEALTLRGLGCRVLAMALITNATESGDSVCHDEVLSAQDTVRKKQETSIVKLLERLSQ